MSILFILKEHGSLTFEELEDIMGSSVEPNGLQIRLSDLLALDKIKSVNNQEGIITFSLNE